MAITDADGFTLQSWDKATGSTTWAKFDGEKTVCRVDFPVEQTLRENAEARAAARPDWAGDWHRVASIPLNVWHHHELDRALGEKDRAFVRRWLNDSGNQAFRTREGRL